MLYVIKTENNDVIVFDSVTSFSEQYQGSVTSHPVEDGSKISDHVITNNVKFKIQGVVSDYNFYNPLKDFVNTPVPAYDFDRTSYLNSLDQDGRVRDIAEDIPDDYSGKDSSSSFSVKASASVVKAKLIEIFNKKLAVTVLEYNPTGGAGEIKSYTNCIITDISFETNPESGYAIYPNISIEQISVVPVKVVQAEAARIIPTVVAAQAAADASKGNRKGAEANASGDKAASKQEAHPELVNLTNERTALVRSLADQVKAEGGNPRGTFGDY